ncbi:hypothetical protein [Nonomuraea sp. SYSU D8015]|nr:hypothetical protein [Nonomuraea sp. SYSU D8015]
MRNARHARHQINGQAGPAGRAAALAGGGTACTEVGAFTHDQSVSAFA